MSYDELMACNDRTFKCRKCRNTHEIHYEPGVTMLRCDCNSLVVVLPDWEPRAVMQIWNTLHAQDEQTPKEISKITKQYIERRNRNGKKSRLDTTAPTTTRPPTLGGNSKVFKSGGLD